MCVCVNSEQGSKFSSIITSLKIMAKLTPEYKTHCIEPCISIITYNNGYPIAIKIF